MLWLILMKRSWFMFFFPWQSGCSVICKYTISFWVMKICFNQALGEANSHLSCSQSQLFHVSFHLGEVALDNSLFLFLSWSHKQNPAGKHSQKDGRKCFFILTTGHHPGYQSSEVTFFNIKYIKIYEVYQSILFWTVT